MNLRVVKVMPFFAPATRFGGVVTQAAKVCARLAARGHDVAVVTTDNGIGSGIATGTWLDHDGYRIYYAPTKAWHRVVPYWSPAMRPALETALADADVCALNVGLTLANHLAAKVAVAHGVPFVYNAEGALCPTRLTLKATRKRMFLRGIERPLLAAAALCQAVTTKEASDLVAQGVSAAKIHIIPNGIEPAQPGDGAAFRAARGIGADAPLVLYLGRLHAVKGLDLLVEAFAASAPEGAHLVIAGHDEDGSGQRAAERVRALGAGDRVHFTGHLEAPARRDALSAADLFALTSRSEGLPNAVLEALAAGVPCLLTEMCNVPEVASAGAGRVVGGTANAVSEAIREMLADPAALGRMGARAEHLAAESFDLDAIVTRLEALYGRVAQVAGTAG